MSKIHIRPAEPRDDEAIGELLVTSFLAAYAVKMPEVVYSDARKRDLKDVAGKRAEGVVLVAEEQGRVVGTVTIYPPGAPKSEAWLSNTADIRQLAVLPERFGEGLSAALMDAAEAAAWAMGVDAISLHTRRGAHGVGRLYERRGYAREPAGDMVLPEVELVAYVLRRSSGAPAS
jgi:predicted N-acetyltransferase YhbS